MGHYRPELFAGEQHDLVRTGLRMRCLLTEADVKEDKPAAQRDTWVHILLYLGTG